MKSSFHTKLSGLFRSFRQRSRKPRTRRREFALSGLLCTGLLLCLLNPSLAAKAVAAVLAVGMLLEVRVTRAALATERKLLEQRVIERSEQLEEAQLRRTLELQKFAEFGRLSAQLLHEVSNPLTVASLYLQQADQRSSAAIKQARRSLQQLERYVITARRQLQNESQPTNFNVQRELRQLLGIMRPVGQKAGVRIVVDAPEAIELYGDPVRFAQIMANLIANAIDAYDNTESRQRTVRVSCRRITRYAQIEVCDNGKGISPLQLPHIFEPFYTTKHDKGRGLGIGLSIVRRTIRDEFHGTICANSTPNGTTFTLLLRLEPPLEIMQLTDTGLVQTAPETAPLLSGRTA